MRADADAANPMTSPAGRLDVSQGAAYVAIGYLSLAGILLGAGRRDYPDLHTALDTGIVLVSGVLAWLLWDLGKRIAQPFPRWLAVSFCAAALAELTHVLVTIEFSGTLARISEAELVLRPATWPPAAYVLPIGIACSVWFGWRGRQPSWRFLLALVALDAAFFTAFYSLPRYTPPWWLGITRPALLPVPLLWGVVVWFCWRRRADRLLPIVGFMAFVMIVAHVAMLYSRAPHDTQAMAAHLGKLSAYLTILLSLMQMASSDMGELVRSERAVAELNQQLERRVEARTAQLESAYKSLEAEIAIRTRAEHAFRESQALLQAISDNSPAVIFAKDLQGRYLLVNPRFCELFKVSRDDIIGKTDYALFSPDAAEVFREMDQRVAALGVALTEEEKVPLADGLHTYISVKCPLRDEAGAIYAIFGIATDISDRTRAEEALRASEERTRTIIETALDAVVTMDATGVITGWSAQAEAVFGWPLHEALGRVLADTIVPEAYREAHRRGLQHFFATGEALVLNQRLELTALHRSGREFPIELSITPIRVGQRTSFSAFVRDITRRKQAEQELRESRAHYQALAESLPHLVWTSGPDGEFDFLSRQWLEYTGRPLEEQLGYGWADQLHPEDRDRVRTAWADASSRRTVFDIEFRIRRADGVYRWFRTRAVPLRDATGTVVKWFGSNTDFEDYIQSERSLQAQLARLNLLDRITRAIGERQDLASILQVVVRSLEDHLPLDFCCVCLYDRVKEVLVVTRVGAKSQPLALDLAMPEKATISIDQNGLARAVRGQLVHEPDIAATTSPFPQRLARGGLRSFVAAPLLVESNVFGVLIAARRATPGFNSAECEFLRQLSEHVALAAHQVELRSALQRAYDDLRQTQQAVMQQERLKALGQMASGIAHDINNAISPVVLYTEALLETERNLSSEAREYLSTIQRAADDVGQTVARMREFYRQREPQLALLPVAVNSLVQQVMDLTRARWSDMPQQRGVVIRTSLVLSPDLPYILGVESEIREALINLVFNAVDAMPGGGLLTIRTDATEGTLGQDGANGAPRRLHVDVTDTGVGMDQETRRLCLEPFFTTKGERGTGLGLSMVYGMVQRHGAAIDVESAPGQGTTMRLTFDAAAPAGAGAAARQAPPRPSRLRILVVDDDPLLLKSLRDTLEVDGHVVTAVNGGQAGIDTFRQACSENNPFAAVVTDLGMPYVDGRQVASAVKQAAPQTPVVLLTGWGLRLAEDGDVPPHVDRVLNKPPKLSELRLALGELTASDRPSS
jgi:PAS domain S-box-containing protein